MAAKSGDQSSDDALDDRERERAERSAALPAHVVHEVVRDEGEQELDREVRALLWSGLTAGLSMGFSFLVEAALQAALPEAPWRGLVAGFGYTVGFVIVVLGRQQLFTESTITATLPVLTHRDLRTLMQLLRLWALVLGANLVGTWAFAAFLRFTHPMSPEVAPALAELAARTVASGFWSTAAQGVLAGWLIALMVWLLPSAGPTRFWVVIFISYVVAALRLPHIVAGSSEAAYGVLTGGVSVSAYWTRFFAPTLLGNCVGGVVLAASFNHAPVAHRVRDETD